MNGSENFQLKAVIEIGATGVRFIAAQINADGSWVLLDRAEYPVTFGRDVFTTGDISRESISLCLNILNRFQELIDGWRINARDVAVIATSALRQARSRDLILDRIKTKTGFAARVIDGIEENRLIYLAVSYALHDRISDFFKSNSLIMEIGGGSTEVMLLRRGKIVAAHSLSLGTVLIQSKRVGFSDSDMYMRRYLEEYIRNTGEIFNKEMRIEQVRQFVAIGGEMRLVAKNIGQSQGGLYSVLSRGDFDAFVEKMQTYSIEENSRRFRISYSDAEFLTPSLLVYKMFLELTDAVEIIVPNVSIREGLLISMASETEPGGREEFYSQVIASAMSLGKKFRFDECHSVYVRKLALKLFDALSSEHGLDDRARLLLEIASVLHDVGSFISADNHQFHSQYIIKNSDIFGLNKGDMDIISQVARFHRGEHPGDGDSDFARLPRGERILVFKLSAILRVADALDRAHMQRILVSRIEKTDDKIIIYTDNAKDIALEKLAVEEKGALFDSVFGRAVVLI